jgi:CubicO group peptidase (beta-lactamase class C family)
MSRHIFAARLPIILLLFAALPSAAQDAVARLEAIVQPQVDKKDFMGAVLVAKGDEIILSKAYGYANLEWNVANTPQAKFRIGSITKQFTAACVLLLEERGKLSIDDPISKHLADSPPTWRHVTIHHLLTHSSGIPSFTDFPDYSSKQALPTTVEQTLQRFRDKPLEFDPGAQMKYSNSGYLVLGALIEKISGQVYATFVQENIFTPLGMIDSGYDSNAAIIPRRAAGYSPSPAGPVNTDFIHMSIPHAAGGLYSTTEDLLRWERALFGGKVLSAASLRKMITPYKGDYALGLVVKEFEGWKVIQHGGGIEGFNTTLRYFPEDRLIIVVLANINGRAPEEIARKIAAAIHGDPTGPKSTQNEPVAK